MNTLTQLGLHQGAQGLLQRVQPYQTLAEGGVFELTQVGEEASPWTETVDALTTAEHVSHQDRTILQYGYLPVTSLLHRYSLR